MLKTLISKVAPNKIVINRKVVIAAGTVVGLVIANTVLNKITPKVDVTIETEPSEDAEV
jgi:hypothetical protein